MRGTLFPAYAGVIPYEAAETTVDKAFPRIRGGDPYTQNPTQNAIFFSPHTRG